MVCFRKYHTERIVGNVIQIINRIACRIQTGFNLCFKFTHGHIQHFVDSFKNLVIRTRTEEVVDEFLRGTLCEFFYNRVNLVRIQGKRVTVTRVRLQEDKFDNRAECAVNLLIRDTHRRRKNRAGVFTIHLQISRFQRKDREGKIIRDVILRSYDIAYVAFFPVFHHLAEAVHLAVFEDNVHGRSFDTVRHVFVVFVLKVMHRCFYFTIAHQVTVIIKSERELNNFTIHFLFIRRNAIFFGDTVKFKTVYRNQVAGCVDHRFTQGDVETLRAVVYCRVVSAANFTFVVRAVLVTRFRYVIRLVAITAIFAGVQGVTLCRTGRIYRRCRINVVYFTNKVIVVVRTAVFAGVTGVTLRATSSVYRFNARISVIGLGDVVFIVARTADRTGLLRVTHDLTGRVYNGRFIVVTKRIFRNVLVAMSTTSAIVLFITRGRTGYVVACIVIIVTKRIYVAVHVGLLTGRTVMAGVALLRTGCILHVIRVVMTSRRIYFYRIVVTATDTIF